MGAFLAWILVSRGEPDEDIVSGLERFGDGLVLLEVWGVGVLLDRYRVDWELKFVNLTRVAFPSIGNVFTTALPAILFCSANMHDRSLNSRSAMGVSL